MEDDEGREEESAQRDEQELLDAEDARLDEAMTEMMVEVREQERVLAREMRLEPHSVRRLTPSNPHGFPLADYYLISSLRSSIRSLQLSRATFNTQVEGEIFE